MSRWLPDGVQISNFPEKTSKPTLFCVHPHGALSAGFFLCALELAKQEPDLVVVGNPYVYHLCPALRLIFSLVGLQLCSSSRKDFQRVMTERKPMLFMPGGFQEAVLASTAQEAVYVNNRRGFIKYALLHGYCIQPIYVFGENKLYSNWNVFEKPRLLISGLNIPAVLFWGHPYIPWIPRREAAKQLRVVFGPVLSSEQSTGDCSRPEGTAPDVETVRKVKAEYLNRLTQLYDAYRSDNDPVSLRLV
jgi:2-acylglycerol O-acyltransferase 2